MKILSLDLIAFGYFTNKSIDLSPGQEGLHIIYGPNEAGKSVALRGIKALLYGIPERTTDDFMHDGGKLRIGGIVRHSDGRIVSFVRRKGRAKTIISPDGTPLNETVLHDFLSGVGLEQFSHMFAINHEDLIRGGKDIITGKGDVGESLYSAGMGGINLRHVLNSLDAEADDLFKPRASTKFINIKVNEYNQTRRVMQDAALPGRKWEEHNQNLREAEVERDRIYGELTHSRSELNRLTRIMTAIPIIGEYKERKNQRSDMGDVLMLPQDFSERRRSAIEELNRARQSETKTREKILRVQSQLDELVIPGDLLLQAEVITEYHKQLGSHLKAMRDLPRLQGEAAQLQTDAEAVLKELRPGLSMAEVESLRVSMVQRENIRNLVTTYSGIIEKQQSSRKLVSSIEKKIESTQEELDKLDASRDIRRLRETVRRIQKHGDLEEALSKATNALKAQEDQAQIDIKKLSLWVGTLEPLEMLPIPSAETIERFDSDFAEIEKNLDNANTQIDEIKDRISVLDTNVKSLQKTGFVPGEEDLFVARQHREEGWKIVRMAWIDGKEDLQEIKKYDPEAPLDQAYEKSVRNADEVADRLRRETERVIQNANWIAEIDQLKEKLAFLIEQRNKLIDGRSDIQNQWVSLWRDVGIEALSPREMRSWIQKQQNLVHQATNIRTCRQAVQGIKDQIDEFWGELSRELVSLGKEEPKQSLTFNALLGHSNELLDEIEDVESRRKNINKKLSELDYQLQEAQRDETEATGNREKWQVKWTVAVKNLDIEDSVAPNAANAVLDKIQDLFEKIRERSKTHKRIEGMLRDNAEFTRNIRELVGRVASDLSRLPVEQAAAELNAMLVKAKQSAMTRDQLELQLEEEKKELEYALGVIRTMTDTLTDMCRYANCQNIEGLEEIEERSAAAQSLDENINQLGHQLLAHTGGGTIDAFLHEAEEVDKDGLPTRIDELSQKIDDLEAEQSAIGETIGKEKAELKGMDGSSRAADAAEVAQGLLALIREGANRYIRLRLASSILRGEIERYRAKNQGPILQRASEIFSDLTIGKFSRLTTDYDVNDNPALTGVRSSGEAVAVNEMSDGTCDQLYLSLRLASLEKHVRDNEPMPFIIDDVLINFDDDRAEATLKVFAGLAYKTQVILFTHHRHLVDLARKSVASDALYIHAI